MKEKKRIIDVIRESNEKKQQETEQISLFSLLDIEDIVIKVRKK